LGEISGDGTTIDWQVDAGDETAFVGGEEYGCRGKLICCSQFTVFRNLHYRCGAWRIGFMTELSKDVNVDDYTRYLSSILACLCTQAANGSTKAELKRTAWMALRYLGAI
jgi:hypothetical protein